MFELFHNNFKPQSVLSTPVKTCVCNMCVCVCVRERERERERKEDEEKG